MFFKCKNIVNTNFTFYKFINQNHQTIYTFNKYILKLNIKSKLIKDVIYLCINLYIHNNKQKVYCLSSIFNSSVISPIAALFASKQVSSSQLRDTCFLFLLSQKCAYTFFLNNLSTMFLFFERVNAYPPFFCNTNCFSSPSSVVHTH